MRIIDFFKLVDPSGVILPLIAPDMKDCLRARFAVGTIVRSLLEGSHNAEGRLKTSTEDFSLRVALCMNNTDYEMFKEYYEGSDYHDLGWIPDPIDAIPGKSINLGFKILIVTNYHSSCRPPNSAQT